VQSKTGYSITAVVTASRPAERLVSNCEMGVLEKLPASPNLPAANAQDIEEGIWGKKFACRNGRSLFWEL
jgi:hypothetical protein